MINVIHIDEETTLATTQALLNTLLDKNDPLLIKWIHACRSFGYNVYPVHDKWVFTRPV